MNFFPTGVSPFNFGQGENYTRDSGRKSIHPHPPMIGHVSGLHPVVNPILTITPVSSAPWGPWTGVIDDNAMMQFTQIEYPNLQKVDG